MGSPNLASLCLWADPVYWSQQMVPMSEDQCIEVVVPPLV